MEKCLHQSTIQGLICHLLHRWQPIWGVLWNSWNRANIKRAYEHHNNGRSRRNHESNLSHRIRVGYKEIALCGARIFYSRAISLYNAVRENGHYSGFLLELCSSWRSNIPDDYDFISEPQHACEGRKFAQIVAYKENFRLGKACVGLYRTYILYIEWWTNTEARILDIFFSRVMK